MLGRRSGGLGLDHHGLFDHLLDNLLHRLLDDDRLLDDLLHRLLDKNRLLHDLLDHLWLAGGQQRCTRAQRGEPKERPT